MKPFLERDIKYTCARIHKMDYDKEKVDEYTVAVLYLVIHQREEGFGARVWKGFDWDTMNRLHERGLITGLSPIL